MIYFKGSDKTIRVSQRIGEIAIEAKKANGNVEIKGGLYDTAMIDRIVPIEKSHGFTQDFVEQNQRAEIANKEEKEYLLSTQRLNANNS